MWWSYLGYLPFCFVVLAYEYDYEKAEQEVEFNEEGTNATTEYIDIRSITRVRRYDQTKTLDPNNEDEIIDALNQIFAGRRPNLMQPHDFDHHLLTNSTSLTKLNTVLTKLQRLSTSGLITPDYYVEDVISNITNFVKMFTKSPDDGGVRILNKIDEDDDYPTNNYGDNAFTHTKELEVDTATKATNNYKENVLTHTNRLEVDTPTRATNDYKVNVLTHTNRLEVDTPTRATNNYWENALSNTKELEVVTATRATNNYKENVLTHTKELEIDLATRSTNNYWDNILTRTKEMEVDLATRSTNNFWENVLTHTKELEVDLATRSTNNHWENVHTHTKELELDLATRSTSNDNKGYAVTPIEMKEYVTRTKVLEQLTTGVDGRRLLGEPQTREPINVLTRRRELIEPQTTKKPFIIRRRKLKGPQTTSKPYITIRRPKVKKPQTREPINVLNRRPEVKDPSMFYVRNSLRNSEGNNSEKNDTESIDPETRPGIPEGPIEASDITSTGCKLTWHPPTDDGGAPIEAYLVEKNVVDTETWELVERTSEPAVEVSGLTPGNYYKFRVKAINNIGESDPLETTESIRVPTVPDQPEGPLEVTELHKAGCKLTWKPPNDDGGSPVTAYLVEKLDMDTRKWLTVDQTRNNVPEMEVLGLREGNEYKFRVMAINKEGESLPLISSSIIARDLTVPDKPEGPLKVSDIREHGCKLTWKAPKEDGGLPIQAYLVEKRDTEQGNDTWEIFDKINTTELIVEELTAGKEYKFRVRAINELGESEPLETVDPIIAKDPSRPEKPEEPFRVYDITKNSCKLKWNPPKDDGGAPITAYLVEKLDKESETWRTVGTTWDKEPEMEVERLVEGEEYKFRVRAINKLGESEPLETFGSIIAKDPDPTCPAWKTKTTTTTTRTTRKFDVEMFLEIVANLTYDYYTNLTQQLNITFQKMSAPTCPSLTTPSLGIDYSVYNDSLRAKCFVCGMNISGVPFEADCADAFAGDFIPLVPQSPKAKGHLGRFRKYCLFQDINNYFINETMTRMVFGRWTGGCSVRWTDVSGIYTQRTCRSKYKAAVGKSYASKRMAKLEMTLQHTDNGCVISPVATLVPLSRAISLYARFHVCVCTGNWCNSAPALLSTILSTMPASILFAMTVTVFVKIMTS